MSSRSILGILIPAFLLPVATLAYCPPHPDPAPQNASPPESRPRIISKDGLITLRAKNRPLKWLLNEISREAGVALVLAEGVGEEKLSIDFQDLPAEEAFRQLLHAYDAFFFYGGEGMGPASLRVVWVYPKGLGQGLQPIPPEKWASTKEVEERLSDPDPDVRARSLEALIDRKGEQALEAVLKALADPEAQVRAQALYHAISAALELPEGVLIDLTLSDSSPSVRFLALEALATGPEAQWVAQRALNDPSPQVQQKAQEILKGLEAASQPRKAAPAQGQRPPQQ